MTAFEIKLFKEKLDSDQDNLTARRNFHEQYEGLDLYWNERYKGNNPIDKFAKDFGSFYWELPEIKEIARQFSSYPPVGNADLGFEPSREVKRATYFLRYHSKLWKEDFPDIDNEREIGAEWKKRGFNALLFIIKQIRDNLFHGQKMQLAHEKYNRDKELVAMAVQTTTLILDNLEKAENAKDY